VVRDRKTTTSTERTEEERERAREERERRRLERSGQTSPPPTVPPLPPPAVSPVPDVAAANGELQRDQVDVEQDRVASTPDSPQRHSLPLEALVAEPAPEPSSRRATRRLRKEAIFRPIPGVVKPHRSALHRPHLHRPHSRGARIFALLALAVVLGALAVGAVLLVHRSERPKIPPPPAIVKVVIPEGYTRAQIAALSHADGLTGSYLVASKHSSRLHPSSYGAPASTPNLEGFLFPATYELYAHTSAARLVSEQLTAFRRNFGGGEVHRAKVLGVTPYELLIVASIIEREAAVAHDRPLVAAVIYNRLHQSMSLGVDSTLRYALHDFTHPLTERELASGSPYNTRVHKGLPPTPISNPGVAAIEAAARPASVSYLYYVAGADGCGEQVFSTSYAQFERNAAAYREALSKNGGHVPKCKKK
jgi:hypothetical protein